MCAPQACGTSQCRNSTGLLNVQAGLGGIYFGLTKRRPHAYVVSKDVLETPGVPPRYTRDAPADYANHITPGLREAQRVSTALGPSAAVPFKIAPTATSVREVLTSPV
eukprot:1196228-Prorocentrum_minimum.AAC.8